MNRFACFILIYFFVCTAEAEQNASLNIELAWGGHVRPNSFTDIAIIVTSNFGGDVDVEIGIGNISYILHERLDSNTEKLISQNIYVADSPNLHMTLKRNKQIFVEKDYHFNISRGNGLTIADTSGSYKDYSTLLDHAYNIISIEPGEFPVGFLSYQNIDALILDEALLTILSKQQILALSEYQANCGVIIIPKPSFKQLRRRFPFIVENKCDNQNILVIDQTLPEEQYLKKITRPSSLNFIDEKRIQELSQATPIRIYYSLFAGVLVLYFLVVSLQVYFQARSGTILLSSITATIVLVIASYSASAVHSIISWFEYDPAQGKAYYSTVLQLYGTGIGVHNIALPKSMAYPAPLLAESSMVMETDYKRPEMYTLHIPVSLFSQNNVFFLGSVNIDPPLTIFESEKKLLVKNLSTSDISGCFALYKSIVYHTVILPAKSEWPVDNTSDLADTEKPYLQLFKTRSKSTDNAVLVPYSLHQSGLIPWTENDSGWLILKSPNT
jgi:hypothetical protein